MNAFSETTVFRFDERTGALVDAKHSSVSAAPWPAAGAAEKLAFSSPVGAAPWPTPPAEALKHRFLKCHVNHKPQNFPVAYRRPGNIT